MTDKEHLDVVKSIEHAVLKKHLADAYHYLHCEKFEKQCDEISDCGEKLVIGCYTCPQSCFK